MNRKLAARCLAELGNLTRLDIYRLLVRAAPDGLNLSEMQARLDLPASTMAFHLRGLVATGLVAQQKIGREVICHARQRHLNTVIEFIREECCKGFADEPLTSPARRAG